MFKNALVRPRLRRGWMGLVRRIRIPGSTRLGSISGKVGCIHLDMPTKRPNALLECSGVCTRHRIDPFCEKHNA